MTLKLKMLMAGCAISLSAIATAGSMGALNSEEAHPWSIIGSLGYTWYDGAYSGGITADVDAQNAIGDGQTALGRFAVARDLWAYKKIHFGGEIGVQSGNDFRLPIPQITLDEIGGVMTQATIKPMLDFLATATWQPMESKPVFGVVKLGVAYRRMIIDDRVTFNDLSQAAFEVQAGLGMPISERATISLNYQGVFDGNTTYNVNTTASIGMITNIPMQNGLFLSIGYRL